MYYLGFTYSDARSLPVSYRKWFIERISKELDRTSKEGETQSKAMHQNDPETRAMLGRSRETAPSRLMRFS